MRIGDASFFAPGVTFAELDLSGARLPEQLHRRIDGYYLQASRACVASGHAFGAGLLQVSAIDALSNFAHGPNRIRRRVVRQDFITFVRTRLQSFTAPDVANVFYESYRNGLVHEARIKNGGQFAFGLEATIDLSGLFPVIDPSRLQNEIEAATETLVGEMRGSKPFRDQLVTYLQQEFAHDLRVA